MRWVLAILVVVLVAGCARWDAPPAATTPAATTSPTPATTPVATTPDSRPYLPVFEGERAFAHVAAQVTTPNGSVRYRIPGTEGNEEVARYIDAQMAALGYRVSWHHFNATYGCVETPMHNVVAQLDGTSGKTIVLAAHYDTRPVADKDPDISRRNEPVLGANDAGSGVGVLLELARVLPPTSDSVRFLFFDGEDGGGYKAPQCATDWILGSRAYAETMSEADVASVRALILVDMVGDPQLILPREGYSAGGPGRSVQDQLYGIADKLGHEQFRDETSYSITDDHVPFLERRIPAVDLIHLIPNDPRVFPSWHHTTFDDMEHVSAESLDAVGETIEAWIAAQA